ncbi:MAG TPA: hypothetical protein ENN92_00370 [candidate division WWE3 bacterium]|uniref:Uncharacterized protein n=1 Tax=candidate division WWE3 bacterium TaxID=2053526 RepID=A0A7C1HDG0_UNCKA|nr:hypothetical protein [candidate division WWE3 bacterium]
MGIGVAAPDSLFHVILGNTEEFRLGYDTTYYSSFALDNRGYLTVSSMGTDSVTFGGGATSFVAPVSFDSIGDITMSSDLKFSNQTQTYISSEAPMYLLAGKTTESDSLYLGSAGAGNVFVISDMYLDGDLALNTGNLLVLDSDDTGDSYFTHDSTNNWISAWVDGNETIRIKADGSVDGNGAFNASAFDLAETFPTLDQTLSQGDLVMIADSNKTDELGGEYDNSTNETEIPSLVSKASLANRDTLVGIVSTKPGITLGGSSFTSEFCTEVLDKGVDTVMEEYQAELEIEMGILEEADLENEGAEETDLETENEETQLIPEITAKLEAKRETAQSCMASQKVLVALAGRVPVKVSLENGPIKAGDPITIGSTAGVGVKATQSGMIVGRALQSYTSLDEAAGKETIIAMIQVTWWNSPTERLASITTADSFNENQVTSEELANLDLRLDKNTNTLLVLNNFQVTGKTTLADTTITGNLRAGMINIDTMENNIGIVGPSCYNPSYADSQDSASSVNPQNSTLCASQTLYLQKGLAGNVNILNGALVIEPNGTVTVAGNLVAEKVSAKQFSVLGTTSMEREDNSANSIGEGVIMAGQNSVVIRTSAIKANSKVFVTATTNAGGRSLYVGSKVNGESFTVNLNSVATTDIGFDWWIVDVE